MRIKEKVRERVKKLEDKIQGLLTSDEMRGKPLIIQRDILDAVEERIELKDRSRPVFPFDQLNIHILATSVDQQSALEAVLLDGETLVEQIRERLRQNDVVPPENLEVNIKFVGAATSEWEERYFKIDYRRRRPANKGEERAPAAVEEAEVVVITGRATRKKYRLDKSLFNIGRLAEVTDEHGRPIRHNHLAFIEDGKDLTPDDREINKTVGREHAHIRFDDRTRAFRLYVDRGDNGTRIFRGGEMTKVTRTNIRGRKLQGGDIVYFGKASLRFEAPGQEKKESPNQQDAPADKAPSGKSSKDVSLKRGRTTRP